MPRGQALEVDGTVIDTLPNTQFKVELDNKHEVLAYTSASIRDDVVIHPRMVVPPFSLTGRLGAIE